jgi:hypothetical protein
MMRVRDVSDVVPGSPESPPDSVGEEYDGGIVNDGDGDLVNDDGKELAEDKEWEYYDVDDVDDVRNKIAASDGMDGGF